MILVGCNSTQPTINPTLSEGTYGTPNNVHHIQEITYEGCQYIGLFNGGQHDWGTHKGTCNNPIHK